MTQHPRVGTGGPPVRFGSVHRSNPDGRAARPYPWVTWLAVGLLALAGCARKSSALATATTAPIAQLSNALPIPTWFQGRVVIRFDVL